jgi:hypothetical protein
MESGECQVHFFNDRQQIAVVLLPCCGHVQIANMNPGDHSRCAGGRAA